jgi:hypothetical protein
MNGKQIPQPHAIHRIVRASVVTKMCFAIILSAKAHKFSKGVLYALKVSVVQPVVGHEENAVI